MSVHEQRHIATIVPRSNIWSYEKPHYSLVTVLWELEIILGVTPKMREIVNLIQH